MTFLLAPVRGPQVSAVAGTAHIVICNWRDLSHPEGGGSELYVESIAAGLAAAGNRVTLMCAAVDGQPRDEMRSGVHYRRRGGRLGVYAQAAWALLSRQVRPDVVLDVQNGMPFLSRLVTRRAVVALVHHVHREQWPILFGPLTARAGWWVESRFAPLLYRRSRYVAVSNDTRRELAELAVDPGRVTVVYNGTPTVPSSLVDRSPTPRVVVLGRLVPHKRIEIAIRAVAALDGQYPDLHLDVVGHGWWREELDSLVTRLGLSDRVTVHGFVDDQTKADLLAAAWVNLVPSVKEGWALSVVEAACVGTPSLAFRDAGGLSESIEDGSTGVLVDGSELEFRSALSRLLRDDDMRTAMGVRAAARAAAFTWEKSTGDLAAVIDAALAQR